MPDHNLTDISRRKFLGVVVFYVYRARHQQPSFLLRNIRAVLEGNEAICEDFVPSRRALCGINSRFARQRRANKTIDSIADGLAASSTSTICESVLRFHVMSLTIFQDNPQTWSLPCAPGSIGGYLDTEHQQGLSILRRITQSGVPFSQAKCRVELTVSLFYKKVWKRLLQFDQLAVATCGNNIAAIEMVEPFFVRLSQLKTAVKDLGAKFDLAERYQYCVTLHLVDSVDSSPSLPSMWGNWLRTGLVSVVLSQGAAMPATTKYKVDFIDQNQKPTNLCMEILHNWSKSVSEPLETAIPKPNPQERTLSTKENLAEAKAVTCYYFMAPNVFGGRNNSGRYAYGSPGYSCVLCDGRQFYAVNFLHFHLLTVHDKLIFKIRNRSRGTVFEYEGVKYDDYVEINVELAPDGIKLSESTSKPVTIPPPSSPSPSQTATVPIAAPSTATVPIAAPSTTTTKTTAPTGSAKGQINITLKWIRPSIDFELDQILKGNWGWLEGQKGRTVSTNLLRNGRLIPKVRRTNWERISDPPVKQKKKTVIPKALYTDSRKVFMRTLSHRYIEEGEYLSDSEEDINEDWLVRKHEEVRQTSFCTSKSGGSIFFNQLTGIFLKKKLQDISELEGISSVQEKFMKLWNNHLYKER
jgi:hypothetical protein